MRKVMLLAVLFVLLWCNSVLAAYVMPIAHGGVQDVQNTIIAVMAKEYPAAQLYYQEQNMLGFRETQNTILGAADAFYTFSVFPKWETDGSTSITVKMTVEFLKEEISRDYFDQVLIHVKALHDGYYLYGFEYKKDKITRIHPDSVAYSAGLREGDKIVSINGYPLYNGTTLGRIMACNVVTFKTKDGKEVTAEGFYITPEQYRQYYFR